MSHSVVIRSVKCQMKPNPKDPLSWITQSVNPRVLRITQFLPQEQKRGNISRETYRST